MNITMYIQISLGTKCQLTVAILIFWTEYAQKVCSRSKTKKVSSTIESCIFELISLGTKFHFKQTILKFGTKFAKKSFYTNVGQIQSSFAQGYHVPGVTSTSFFRIARYHYYFNVSSPKVRRDNKNEYKCAYMYFSYNSLKADNIDTGR